jgi:hypothetical protein
MSRFSPAGPASNKDRRNSINLGTDPGKILGAANSSDQEVRYQRRGSFSGATSNAVDPGKFIGTTPGSPTEGFKRTGSEVGTFPPFFFKLNFYKANLVQEWILESLLLVVQLGVLLEDLKELGPR